ncbi:PIN domain-containing protein [Flexivirga sp.]|uniref:PIN domain-containing protein n=1 Tax=Flexivirga sp. TaxID=1962927 RepID=UPI003F81E618
MIALLDTNILIARGTPDEPAPDLSGFDDLAVSSLTWAELTKGLHTTGQLAVFKERLSRLTALQRTFGAGLPFDDACVSAYDTILARVAATGGSARSHVVDRMVAATAMAHGCVLVSRDTNGFRGLEDLLTLEVR